MTENLSISIPAELKIKIPEVPNFVIAIDGPAERVPIERLTQGQVAKIADAWGKALLRRWQARRERAAARITVVTPGEMITAGPEPATRKRRPHANR